jgi:hypothetical protein
MTNIGLYARVSTLLKPNYSDAFSFETAVAEECEHNGSYSDSEGATLSMPA